MNTEELPALPGDIQALLDTERASADAFPVLKASVRAHVAARLATHDSPAASKPIHDSGRLLRIGTKLIVPALTFAMGVGAGVVWQAHRTPPAPVSQAALAPIPSAPPPMPSPPPSPAKMSAAPAPPLRKIVVAPKSEVAAITGDAALAAENALVERARIALGRGESELALQAIDAHRRQFPRGQLTEEREALRVQALVAGGKAAEARTVSTAFHKSFPDSLFGAAVDAAFQANP